LMSALTSVGDGDGLCKKGLSDRASWCHMIGAIAYSICVG